MEQSQDCVALATRTHTNQILTTAIIQASNHNCQYIECRALLDTGSTANFITEEFATILNLRKRTCAIPVGSIGDRTTYTQNVVYTKIASRVNGYRQDLSFLTVPRISDFIPSNTLQRDAIKIPPNVRLADPEFHKPAPISVLLGAGPTLAALCIGQYKLSSPHEQDLRLQKTQFGWVLGGSMPQAEYQQVKCHTQNADFSLQRFWEIEEGPQTHHWSAEERRAADHFSRHHRRDASGRYIVALPFNERRDQLGESYKIALKRFHALEQKLKTDPELQAQYEANIQEYQQLQYLTKVTDGSETKFYLPHHAVIKRDSTTTKVRVVYDGSAKTTSGVSLNDVLMVGPTIQDDIFHLVLRFRSHKYVLTGDVEKMYLQFGVRKEDRCYQRILWRDERGCISTYELNTITFGLASSPFQAIQCVRQLAEDEAHRYPTGADIIKKDMYVDDLLTGFNTIHEGVAARQEVTELLRQGGLNIRQWASNDPRLLAGVPENAIHKRMQLDDGSALKTLGVFWDAQSDSIIYTVKPLLPNKAATKRIILSEIAKIYDPLGLLGPVILGAKIIIQKLWQLKLDWDESLPQHINTEWANFCAELNALNDIAFPRTVCQDNGQVMEMHGFCDASIVGYGACIYLRSTDSEGRHQTRLFCAKSRVAPLKTTSLPRLELCGALLLARLYKAIKTAVVVPISRTVLWSDSTITLHWIGTSPHLLKTFVANRVAEIQEATPNCEWRHVPGNVNPADALSRGQQPREFTTNTLWTAGPPWLSQNEQNWPWTDIVQPKADPEAKRVTCLTLVTKSSILIRFSSIQKLKRFVALALRFKRVNRDRHRGPRLHLEEIDAAELRILRLVQGEAFHGEIRDLEQQKELDSKSKLLSLSPYLDENGILRVGGRLRNATLPESQKHPALLPKQHHVTTLIIQNEHRTHGHAGALATLYAVRRRFWILDGRNEVRRVIRTCITCTRAKPKTVEYVMGDLPRTRVTQARPFINVGIDYCGPFFIKEKKYRNRVQIKAYVAVFICLVTKAIHLELVSDMTTAAFIGALRRFIGRRGKCQMIQSDNGTNFIGAKNELKELVDIIRSDLHNDQVADYLAERGIQWRLIPPVSPHFGGIWESAVKSFKHHLKRVVGKELFTFEEFNTLIIEIEAILNSRPLTPISADPNDLLVLTPGHFLIGDSLTNLPEHDFTQVATNRLSSWQHIQKTRQHFWARWYKEYLNELNIRRKWATGQPSLKPGVVVLIKDDNLPPMQWRMGRIIELHPGSDEVARVATLKTNRGLIKRNLRKLAPLPIDTTINSINEEETNANTRIED